MNESLLDWLEKRDKQKVITVLAGDIRTKGPDIDKPHGTSASNCPRVLPPQGQSGTAINPDSENAPEKAGLSSPFHTETKLNPWLTRIQSATTLDALEKLLKEFSVGEWTLIDKRDLSDAYTPVALKLIDSEQANKWQILENLVSLCWQPTGPG